MSGPPSLDAVAAFAAVMEHGSLSAAARALGRAQPTVRRQVAALERDLGVALFLRAENGLVPTAQARALEPIARGMADRASALRRAASDLGQVAGIVRITATRAFAAWVLPPVVATLARSHPRLVVEVAPEDAVVDLMDREADIALRLAPPDRDALRARRLPSRRAGLFAAAGLASPVPAEAGLAEHLAATPMVWEDRDAFLARGLADAGLSPPARVAVRTDDPAAQALHVAAGAGAGVLVEEAGRALGLRRLAPGWSHPLPLWLAMHEDHAGVPRIRAAFDALAEGLGTRPRDGPGARR